MRPSQSAPVLRPALFLRSAETPLNLVPQLCAVAMPFRDATTCDILLLPHPLPALTMLTWHRLR